MPIDAETDRRAPRARSAATVTRRAATRSPPLPPTWRPDLTDPYDLVEEVARIVGYDRSRRVLPAAPAGRGLTREQRLRRRVGSRWPAPGSSRC